MVGNKDKNLLTKSNRSLKAAQLAYDNNLYDDCISRYYYSAYHIINYIVKCKKPGYKPQKDSRASHEDTYEVLMEILTDIDYSNFDNIKNLAGFYEIKAARNNSDYTYNITIKDDIDSKFKPRFDKVFRALSEIKGTI